MKIFNFKFCVALVLFLGLSSCFTASKNVNYQNLPFQQEISSSFSNIFGVKSEQIIHIDPQNVLLLKNEEGKLSFKHLTYYIFTPDKKLLNTQGESCDFETIFSENITLSSIDYSERQNWDALQMVYPSLQNAVDGNYVVVLNFGKKFYKHIPTIRNTIHGLFERSKIGNYTIYYAYEDLSKEVFEYLQEG